MKKLSLILDDLDVESFHVSPARLGVRGTVQGNETDTWSFVSPSGGCTFDCPPFTTTTVVPITPVTDPAEN
jgi:hypothetical protein